MIDIMCRKMGQTNISDVTTSEQFEKELKKNIDPNPPAAALFGVKSAGPKLLIDLIIIDWDSPSGGIVKTIKEIKSKYSGNFNFIVVADKSHIPKLPSVLNAGAYDFLVKPFAMSDFKDKVQEALSGKPKVIVQSFSLGGGASKSKTSKVVENPFAMKKEKPAQEKPKPVKAPSVTKSAPIVQSAKVVNSPAKKGDSKGRASFYRGDKQKVISKDGGPTATLIDGKIDGHYHEKVEIIGGGENCFWAKEMEEERVRLEYLNAKGKATGMEAKIITKEEFMYSFYLCEEHGCQILKRLGKWPPPEQK